MTLLGSPSYPLQTHQDYKATPIYNVKDEHRRCSTDLDLLHHWGKSGLLSPVLLGGVLLFNNHHFIAPLAEDSDSLRS